MCRVEDGGRRHQRHRRGLSAATSAPPPTSSPTSPPTSPPRPPPRSTSGASSTVEATPNGTASASASPWLVSAPCCPPSSPSAVSPSAWPATRSLWLAARILDGRGLSPSASEATRPLVVPQPLVSSPRRWSLIDHGALCTSSSMAQAAARLLAVSCEAPDGTEAAPSRSRLGPTSDAVPCVGWRQRYRAIGWRWRWLDEAAPPR